MNFKSMLPFENYQLTTRLSVEEVLKRIQENIQEKPKFGISSFSSKYSKPYSGKIAGAGFAINRNINYRNSFLPVITGEIDNFLGKTQVHIKMRLLTPVLIFICFWLGAVGIASVVILIDAFSGSHRILPAGYSLFALVPLVMFVFACLLTYFAFKIESRKSRKFLLELLEGVEE